jgi:hypothetical protein
MNIANKTSKKWSFNAIWIITLLPVVIALAMTYSVIGMPNATKNNGILAPAGIHVPETLTNIQQGKWGLLVISENCNSLCQQQVYRMQQLHKSMGKFYERIQPIWLTTQNEFETENLTSYIDFTEVSVIHNNNILSWFNKQALSWQDQSVWLIDPTGTLVMRFPPELTARQVMSDLKWLLKISRIG